METKSLLVGNIISTVVLYFDFESDVAEIKSKIIVEDIRSDFLAVDNLPGVSFRNNYKKLIVVVDFNSTSC